MSAEEVAYRIELISYCGKFAIRPICVCIADRLIEQYGARSAYERYHSAMYRYFWSREEGRLRRWLDENGLTSCYPQPPEDLSGVLSGSPLGPADGAAATGGDWGKLRPRGLTDKLTATRPDKTGQSET